MKMNAPPKPIEKTIRKRFILLCRSGNEVARFAINRISITSKRKIRNIDNTLMIVKASLTWMLTLKLVSINSIISPSKNNHRDKQNAGNGARKCKNRGMDLYFALQKNIEKLKAGIVIRKNENSINFAKRVAASIFPDK